MNIFTGASRGMLLSALFLYGCGVPTSRNTTGTEVKEINQATGETESTSTSANGVYRIRPSTPESIDKIFGLLEANKIAYSSVPEGDVIVKLDEETKIKLEKQIKADAKIMAYETYPKSNDPEFDPSQISYLPEEEPLSAEENEKNLIKAQEQIDEARGSINLFGQNGLRSYNPEAENDELNLAEGAGTGAVDLSKSQYFPPIKNQIGGTCQSFSTGYYPLSFMYAQANKIVLQKAILDSAEVDKGTCSPYFIYSQHSTGAHSKSSQRDGLMAMYQTGCALYSDYIRPTTDKESLENKPTAAQMLKGLQTMRLSTADSTYIALKVAATAKDKAGKLITDKYYAIKQITALIDQEKPVPFSLTVYEDFDTYPQKGKAEYFSDNKVIYAQPGGKKRGGHGVTVVGYDDNLKYTPKDADGKELKDAKGKVIVKKGALLIANSWADTWGVPNSLNIAGKNGFFWLGYDYAAESGEFFAFIYTGVLDKKPEIIGLFTVKDTTAVDGVASDYRYTFDIKLKDDGTYGFTPVKPTDTKTMSVFMEKSVFKIKKDTMTNYPIDLTELVDKNTGIAVIKSTDTAFLKSFKLADVEGYPKYETDPIADNQLTIRISKLDAKCGTANGKEFTEEPLNKCSKGSAAIADKDTSLGWEWTCGVQSCKATKPKVVALATATPMPIPTATIAPSPELTIPKGTVLTMSSGSTTVITGPMASPSIAVPTPTPVPAPITEKGGAVKITSAYSSLAGTHSANITFIFANAPLKFESKNISLKGGGTLTSLTKVSSKVYTVLFTPLANFEGTASISLSAPWTNSSGTKGTIETLSISVDNVIPSVIVSTNKTALKVGDKATMTFTFSEKIKNFSVANLRGIGFTATPLAFDGDKTYTTTLTATEVANTKERYIRVVNKSFEDLVGNKGTEVQLDFTKK